MIELEIFETMFLRNAIDAIKVGRIKACVIHAIEVGRVMFASEQIIRIVLYVIILWSYEVYDRVICY